MVKVFSPQALTYNSNFDENSGLDYCLDVLLRGDDMPNPQERYAVFCSLGKYSSDDNRARS